MSVARMITGLGLCTGLVLVGCAGRDTVASGINVEKLKNNAQAYQGKQVKVVAEVGEYFSDNLARVDDEGLGGPELYVIRDPSLSPLAFRALADADRVLVEGDVGYFVKSESEYDEDGDLNAQVDINLEGQPVLYARKVTLLED